MTGICHIIWSRGRHFSPSLPGDRYLNLGSKSDLRAEIPGSIVWYDALAPRPRYCSHFLLFMQIRCGYIGNLDFRFFLFVTLISPWILASSSLQKFEFWLQNFRFISEFVSFQSFRKLKYPFKTSFETISTVELSCGVLKSRVCNVTKSIVDQLMK